ncbi:uncharacterized protein LOC118429611 [Branchiostoma floridae]|uniref:Uncharacterized protein LOC118429611 n=1 Tax=Branchiostoma floridae TaxID=7739 RepID=A0A9J7M7N0_BRAFL|nr:uncharacterized protein LOC118429611 [Branchiostoma floridae]
MVPLAGSNGKTWFGVGSNGKLYRRYEDGGGTWHWVDHGYGKPDHQLYNAEPCVNGPKAVEVTTSNGHLAGRHFWGGNWLRTHHGRPYDSHVIATGCSNVNTSGSKSRTFLRGSDGDLYEHYYDWGTGFRWRWHGVPAKPPAPPATYVDDIKTTSYYTGRGRSNVFVVGTDGNLWQLWTKHVHNSPDTWFNRGKPAGKVIRHIHASRGGLRWAITTDGSVCRAIGAWPCYSLPNRKILDCSDPFLTSAGRSMFCNTVGTVYNPSYSGYRVSIYYVIYCASWVFGGPV